MRIIKIMVDHADDTLEEAHEYYRDYVIFKETNPEYASLSLELARTHLNLYDKIHAAIVNMITKYKSDKEIPATMLNLWNYEHEKLKEEYDELKYKINNA